MLKELDNSNISKHLGQTSQYKSTYDKSLLVREPRANNRQHLSISDDKPPFVGYDIWNAYEVSCLCENGTPITGFAKIVYPATNEYIVESKSIKLYLNSYNMTRFAGTVQEVVAALETLIASDLSVLLETKVAASIFISQNADKNSAKIFSIDDYITLETFVNQSKLVCTEYKENPNILQAVETRGQKLYYHSSLLKSNCRVTSQPDWGDVYIYYKGKYAFDEPSLLKYIVSFRDECHFHEEICETIYKRIWDRFEPEELVVTCLYVRRGGIDINPTRASHVDLLNKDLINSEVYFTKTLRQ